MKTIKEIVLQHQKQKAKEEYDSYLQDVLNHGCTSGMVSDLIYYTDTEKFYKKHLDEINELLKGMLEDTGLNLLELFGDKFDRDDPLCLETHNQNLLAWFAYEETARQILEEQGIEV